MYEVEKKMQCLWSKMKPLHTLHRHLPGHLAMNAALLIRSLRPVVQVDVEDADKVKDMRKAVRTVAGLECDTWAYSVGHLMWVRGRRLPADVRRAITALQALPRDAPLKSIAPHTRTCLRLRCPVAAYTEEANRFRVLLSVATDQGEVWSFKQQMCVDAGDLRKLFEELQGYSGVADEMGFFTVEMRVVKVQTRYHSATLGPRRSK